MQLIWIASLFFAVLIALFALQNTAPVGVNVLLWSVQGVAVSTLVLAAAALGALLTYLFGLSRGIRSRLEVRGARATIRDQDRIISELRERIRELESQVRVNEVVTVEAEPSAEKTVPIALPPAQPEQEPTTVSLDVHRPRSESGA